MLLRCSKLNKNVFLEFPCFLQLRKNAESHSVHPSSSVSFISRTAYSVNYLLTNCNNYFVIMSCMHAHVKLRNTNGRKKILMIIALGVINLKYFCFDTMRLAQTGSIIETGQKNWVE